MVAARSRGGWLLVVALAFVAGPAEAAGLDPWLAHCTEAGSADLARLAPQPSPALFHVDPELLERGRVRVQLDTGPGGPPAAGLRPACLAAVPSLDWELDAGSLAQVTLALADLRRLAGVNGILYILRPPCGLPLAIGAPTVEVTGAGVSEIGADAYHRAGLRGEGLIVGVLDVGFDGAAARIDVGLELPRDTRARAFARNASGETDLRGFPRTSHGTACAEIVHDVAPRAGLRLANATSQLELEAAVDWLREEGVHVISHSVGWFWGPGDGTGLLADIVQRAIARDIVWVNAAGNQAERYWGGTFRDSDGDGLHEFDAAGDSSLTARAAAPDSDFRFVLTWDRWPVSPDLTFEVEIYWNGELLASSAEAANPEIYAFREVFARTPGAGTVEILLRRTRGTADARLRLFRLDDSGRPMPEHATPSGSLVLPADTPGVLAVGAYRRAHGQPLLEPFSSRGPTLTGVAKPEVCALDSVATSVRPVFQGTSASAPLVAGALALLQQTAPAAGFFDFRWDQAELRRLLAWAAHPSPFADPEATVWGLLHLPAPQTAADEIGLRLVSPACGVLSLSFARTLPGPAEIRIHDLEGRCRSAEPWRLQHPSSAVAQWSARDARGRPLPAGIYLVSARGPGWRASAHVLWLP